MILLQLEQLLLLLIKMSLPLLLVSLLLLLKNNTNANNNTTSNNNNSFNQSCQPLNLLVHSPLSSAFTRLEACLKEDLSLHTDLESDGDYTKKGCFGHFLTDLKCNLDVNKNHGNHK